MKSEFRVPINLAPKYSSWQKDSNWTSVEKELPASCGYHLDRWCCLKVWQWQSKEVKRMKYWFEDLHFTETIPVFWICRLMNIWSPSHNWIVSDLSDSRFEVFEHVIMLTWHLVKTDLLVYDGWRNDIYVDFNYWFIGLYYFHLETHVCIPLKFCIRKIHIHYIRNYTIANPLVDVIWNEVTQICV